MNKQKSQVSGTDNTDDISPEKENKAVPKTRKTGISSKKSSPTFKQVAFAKEYVKNKGNATQAYREAYNPKSDLTARVESQRTLQKPIVQSLIVEEMEKCGLTDNEVAKTHARNLKQNKNLSVSQQAIRDYYNIKGYTGDNRSEGGVNIAFIMK